jgi:apolipoprotein N-acyltransferase
MTFSDAQGRLVARAVSNPRRPELLVASVSPGPGPTIYTRIGDCFAWLCALASLIMLAVIARPRAEQTHGVFGEIEH